MGSEQGDKAVPNTDFGVRPNVQPWSRPIFRWAGSKKGIIPLLQRRTPSSFDRYIEPFAGSACLFFALNPERAILSDFNAELMHAYRALAKHPRIVTRTASGLPNDAVAYYAIREVDPEELSETDRAARFLYLNRHCFNGVYRTNRQNCFNVPMGSRAGQPLTESEAIRCATALRRAVLVTGDFEATLDYAKRNDFVYIDPPYTSVARQTYGEYGYGAFSHADVKRLLNCLDKLSDKGAKVLLSYVADEEVVRSLKGWSVLTFPVRRRIAGGSRVSNAIEILASNFE
ncbi:DNA adenine methylase [Rubrivivax gelatinosus]|uniref:DNA adenine methylase n=1 Tax=Rubrivivax gelatinosus TaxID=28068 RepID=UPI001908C24F|nr:Dam family site-specific DNA-(adenine-N6)-methyltransferase [Rubrivivax gelatinosus]